MKPLIVGEANPYQTDPRLAQHYAMYPYPPRCAGWRLCHKVMQLEEDEYLRRFDRVNLCNGDWRVFEARRKADDVSRGPDSERAYVLCGARVASTFAFILNRDDFKPFTRHQEVNYDNRPRSYVIIPHPSGLSRAWNEPGAFERARAVLREAGVL